jgi:hypothetical protein
VKLQQGKKQTVFEQTWDPIVPLDEEPAMEGDEDEDDEDDERGDVDSDEELLMGGEVDED